MALPPQAQACVDRIFALLDEAQALGLDRASGEEAYALRTTRERYLPETLDAYAHIPAAMRSAPDATTGRTPDEQLLEQLEILERATAQRLTRLAEHGRTALSANGRFLVERLGALDTLPEAPQFQAHSAPVTAQRFVDSITAGARRNRDLVNAVATRLQEAFPLLTEVDRGMFGAGPARRIAITVPIGNDRLRYALTLGRGGEVETTCAKMVRGVTIRTEQVPFEEWARGLYGDLHAYAQSSAQVQDMLEQLTR
ncbi:MAG TPA: hypothetical protein VFH72_03895 [Candidatus Baltobacteraceae bacterium]|jgi:hypothetical protein|nr:hypothetical protein [Candidatus Baltobacteraceae bacterium]